MLAPLSAEVIPDVRYKISAGDLTSADAITDEFCRTNGATSECADAVAWLARGAFIMKDPDRTRAYLTRAKGMTQDLAKKTRPEDDAYLAAAMGAVIEVEARLLASEGRTDKAIALLQSELPHWNLFSIRARIQKNLNLLTLEGKPAPALKPELRGHPILLFLWGHWCSDCTGQAPIIARIRQRYESQGLLIVAPTRRIGSVNGDDQATPEQEDAGIERVWKQSYPGLADVPHPVDQSAMLAYGVSSTPTLVLIDRSNIVRMYCPYRMSESDLARHIDAILR